VVGEGHRRQIDQIGTLGKRDGPPCSPVHGNGTIWVSAADRLCRLLGVEMALTKAGSPASDRHQGDVDVRHLLVRKMWARVPRIPAPAGARNEIAECGSAMGAPRVPTAVVVGGQDMYLQAPELNEFTRLDLVKFQAARGDWLEQAARACWGNENRGGWDESE
jgi:hypothetical protein